MEGGIDSSHVSFLHSGNLKTDPLFKGSRGNKYNFGDLLPVFEVVEVPAGSTWRTPQRGRRQYYWRITPWVMPFFTVVRRAATTRSRPFRRPDRQRELLDLELRLHPCA